MDIKDVVRASSYSPATPTMLCVHIKGYQRDPKTTFEQPSERRYASQREEPT
jgi:hypothetical protein